MGRYTHPASFNFLPWRIVVLQSSLVVPSIASYAFYSLTLNCHHATSWPRLIVALFALCSLYMPKIIKFYVCIHLLPAK